MTDTVIEARGLRAGYGPIEVLRGIDLHVNAGEVVALLGANGAGKTTTLLALSGALPSSGHLEVMGSTTPEPMHRRIGRGMQFLPEERGIIKTLSVADNLNLGGVDIDRAIELTPELSNLLGRSAGNLSGGEQQLLALTRALGVSPTLLLADELSFGLAPLVVTRMLKLCRACADNGAGVLIVEQYARQALQYADRAYVMRQGKLVVEGSAEELASQIETIEDTYVRSSTG